MPAHKVFSGRAHFLSAAQLGAAALHAFKVLSDSGCVSSRRLATRQAMPRDLVRRHRHRCSRTIQCPSSRYHLALCPSTRSPCHPCHSRARLCHRRHPRSRAGQVLMRLQPRRTGLRSPGVELLWPAEAAVIHQVTRQQPCCWAARNRQLAGPTLHLPGHRPTGPRTWRATGCQHQAVQHKRHAQGLPIGSLSRSHPHRRYGHPHRHLCPSTARWQTATWERQASVGLRHRLRMSLSVHHRQHLKESVYSLPPRAPHQPGLPQWSCRHPFLR